MVVKEYDYIKGNAALQPSRKENQREDKERIKRKKARKNKKLAETRKYNRKALAQIALLIFVMGTITIFREAQLFKMQREIETITSETKSINDENEALNINLLKSSSIKSVREAAEKMGMVNVTKENTVSLDLSQNYFQGLDDKDAAKNKASQKGIFNKVMDALGI